LNVIDTGSTILVVDDEPGLRELAADLLSESGFRVLQAADGYEALRVLSREDRIELLLTDIVMPGLGGFALARQARLMRPELKILYITAFASEYGASEYGASDPGPRYGPVLHKPYHIDELVAEVRQALAEGPLMA
jgi:CheY-like chemotaxis protein